MRFVPVVFGLVACATGEPRDLPGGDARGPGTDSSRHDGPRAVADTSTSGGSAKLLLSEIQLSPSTEEFIEIVNPSNQTVDLSAYYLSDNGDYFQVPAGAPAVTSGDFIVKFPAASSIAGHGVVTVALGTAVNFNAALGVQPTYSIADGTVSNVSENGTPTLTDAGELVVLFTWDGTSPLVKDADMMLAGVPTVANSYIDKSGYMQNGGTYLTDADTLAAQATAPATGKSTKRIALEAGHEIQNGTGNGINGDDETSEDTSATWDSSYSAPTPGQVPAALLE